MKANFKTLFVLFTSLLVGQAVTYSYAYTSTVVGDVRIQTLNNGSLYCDSLICPPGTTTCKVTKHNDPNNFNVIIRHRICIGGNGRNLAEEKIREENRSHSRIDSDIVSGSQFQSVQSGSSRPLTPEEQRRLEEHLRFTQHQVQAEVDRAMQGLQMRLNPFFDGSFYNNLNNRIRQSFSKYY